MTATPPQTTIAFVCVHNAGRSQMAAAFARRERDRREYHTVEILTGGTDPADTIHSTVLTAMAEVDIDLSTETPREISQEDLHTADLVVTMGCDPTAGCPAGWTADTQEWDLPDPATATIEETRDIRETIDRRVTQLFDTLATAGSEQELPLENN